MEVTKFWTKTKIIILCAIFLVIVGIVIGIFIHRAQLKKTYKKLEGVYTNAISAYLKKEKITIGDGEYRKTNIEDIRKVQEIEYKRVNDCSGYVISENNNNKITSKTYLKCKNIYTTPGYGSKTVGKENKDKTQSEDDTTPPVVYLIGEEKVTLYVGDKYEEKGAYAKDEVDGDIKQKDIKITGEVDTSKAGTYKIKYVATDKAKNSGSKTRTVIVKEDDGSKKKNNGKDTTPPVIAFNSPDVYQKVCLNEKVITSYKDKTYGFTAIDDVDGDLTKTVKISGNTKTNKAGTYTLTYTVKDKAGNETVATRDYSVVDCDNPDPTPTPTPDPTPTPTPDPTPTPTPTPTPDPTPAPVIQPSGISVNEAVVLTVGQSQNLNASVLPANATNKTLSYSSSNPGVVSVDSNGNVKGLISGREATITITTSNGRTAYVTVYVR